MSNQDGNVLFGVRGLIHTILISSASIFGIILAQKNGMLPTPNHAASFNQWQVLTVLFVMVGWFAFFARSRANAAYIRAMGEAEKRKRTAEELQEALDQLAAANGELASHRDNLEELVHERTIELAAARERAESADRAKSALLSAVSHEMKTPLNHISGMGYLISGRTADAKTRECAEIIVKAANRLDKLIGGILDYTQAESSSLSLALRDFTLDEAVAGAESAVRDAAAEKGIAVERRIDPGLVSSHFHGDPRRIAQVLEILMDNAVKFSDRGPVMVRIGSADGNAAIPVIRFEVQDHGIGFAEGRLKEFLEPFRQGEEGLTRRFGGMGLGLAFARRLVALMAGEFGATSEECSGSTFWFTLPLPAGGADRQHP